MDVSHGSLGQSDILSIAAVISSRQWPLISHHRASVSTQSLNFEMIDSLIKHMSDTKDNCIFKELMLNFYVNCGNEKPHKVTIFREGVSESQFNQVRDIELNHNGILRNPVSALKEQYC
ncbi:unnamed protein product [Fraxinus pennsylvanica]|uniref:Piwi domain-containing protein n=1 Tax=Fraxinus pennsylvanica TaxID=56036 RepID=A0AAD2AKC7_9LAMI|nr:unnamed protein product [Fraxinus pennsylvanica]